MPPARCLSKADLPSFGGKLECLASRRYCGEPKENSLPGIGKGDRLCSGTLIDPIYWTKNVAEEGADRLPFASTAMSVIVLSPVWVTYTTARSPVVAWSRTPFR